MNSQPNRTVTMQGKPVIILGDELKVDHHAPTFTVIGKDLSFIKLADFQDKIVVINSVPSVDTKVCDMQVRRFNQEAAKLGKDVIILSISADLPFALERYCAAAGIDNLITTSDHRDLDFGKKYGLILKDLRLLSRAVIVIGKDKIIKHIEYVKEITDLPDFNAALKAIKELI